MIEEVLDFLEAMNKCKEISDEAEQKLINFFKGRSYYDCVSRERVIEYIKDCDAELMHDSENESVREDIMDMPPVLPTQKIGKWLLPDKYYDKHIWRKCSVCGNHFEKYHKYITFSGETTYTEEKANYCKVCGANMRGCE